MPLNETLLPSARSPAVRADYHDRVARLVAASIQIVTDARTVGRQIQVLIDARFQPATEL